MFLNYEAVHFGFVWTSYNINQVWFVNIKIYDFSNFINFSTHGVWEKPRLCRGRESNEPEETVWGQRTRFE